MDVAVEVDVDCRNAISGPCLAYAQAYRRIATVMGEADGKSAQTLAEALEAKR